MAQHPVAPDLDGRQQRVDVLRNEMNLTGICRHVFVYQENATFQYQIEHLQRHDQSPLLQFGPVARLVLELGICNDLLKQLKTDN